jgi:hypothetical protein
MPITASKHESMQIKALAQRLRLGERMRTNDYSSHVSGIKPVGLVLGIALAMFVLPLVMELFRVLCDGDVADDVMQFFLGS